MSAFRNLRDLCINYQEDLQNDATQLFCARVGQCYDEEITNKMQDLSLFSAKLRLLQAKSISMGPNRPIPSSEEASIARYEDTAMLKVLEQKTVKSVGQFHDVRKLLSTPDSKLDVGLMERKDLKVTESVQAKSAADWIAHAVTIISKLIEYRHKEEQLREAEAMLTKAEEEHSALRSKWDQELGALRDLSERASNEEEMQEGPLYNKLQALIQKMEMMRWLISRLVTARSGYDWLSDPDRRLRALKVAREANTIHSYTGV